MINFFVIVVAYLFCYGLTALIIFPAQSAVLGDMTLFASLCYLPHGIRILATMFVGWQAIPALMLGNFLSKLFFTDARIWDIPDILLLQSMLVSATCALVSFEVLKFLGRDLYWKAGSWANWKQVVLVGILASFLNSLGQILVFSQTPDAPGFSTAPVIFAIGDVIGLLVTLFGLMFCLRWIRLSKRNAGD